jgi:hypothetical protein
MKKNNTSKTKNVKPNVKPDIKPDIKPDEDAIIKKEPIIKANIDWDKIDKAMSKISTLGGLKEYWSHNKDMQTMDEFKNLKDKHKTRIDGITNK